MVDFLFALIGLSLSISYGSGVMTRNVYSSAAFTGCRPLCTQNFTWMGSSSINHSWRQKTRDTELPEGEDCILHSFDTIPVCNEETDRQMDGRTDGFAVAYTTLAKLES